MKIFGKLLIAALIIGILLPFTLLKGKDGNTLMSISDLKMPDLNMPDMPDIPSLPKTGSDGSAANSGGKTTIYQWKDNDGNIQFTNTPPPAGIEYTVKGYDPNTNVIQSVKLPEGKDEPTTEPEKVVEDPSADGVGSVYSPEKIKKLFDDAENIEKLLNDRLEKQNALIGE